MMKIRILIADDHELIRDAVAMALTLSNEFEVFTARDYCETVTFLKQDTRIDIVMLDLIMPDMDGLTSIKQIVELNRNGAVVLFSGNVKPQLLSQAIEAGCAGLIPKSLPLKSLASALKFVNTGQVFIPAEAKVDKTSDVVSNLSERDIVILKQVADGKTNKEIAWKLGLSEVTIKVRMRTICSRLNANNRASAVINALYLGVI